MEPNLHLKNEREQRGWSQSKVANEIGTSDKNVGRWERGQTSPNPYFREKLCILFGKNAQALGFVKDISVVAQQNSLSSILYDPTVPPLPNEGRGLVGRQEMLDELAAQLCRRRCVVLSGLPGVGKTAIAVMLLHHPNVSAAFSHGVLWAGLGPCPKPVMAEQLNRWGALLGLSMLNVGNDADARAIALRAAIGMRRIVLVVDDAWEIDDALSFKVGGPNCAFLTTTRSPAVAMGVAHDGVYTVRGLERDDGLVLLAQLAPQVVQHYMHDVETLVHDVDGLPLALTLLGRNLHVQYHCRQSRRLEAALTKLRDASQRLLVSGPLAPFERSPGLAAGASLSLDDVISTSDRQLDEQARAVFYALSVFPARPNSFSEEAALMVTRTSTEVLDTLCDVGLLEGSGPGRYSLHRVIADYASVHLTETLARERLVAYCIPFIENHCSDYEALECECRNLLAGLKYAFEGGFNAPLVRGVNSFASFMLVRGLYDQALLHLQRAYQVSIWSGDTPALITVLQHLGRAKYQKREYNQAEVYLREGLSLINEGISPDQTCQLLTLLSTVALQQENLAQAEVYSRQGLLLACELANNQSKCDLLMTLAHVYGAQGEGQRAETYLHEAFKLAKDNGLLAMMGRVLSMWGEIKLRQRQFSVAQGYFLQALNYIQQDEPEQLASIEAGLADVVRAQSGIEETDG